MIHSFEPVVLRGARVLILGSMPGVRSLKDKQYYAHPQNQFWSLMAKILGFSPNLPYENRILELQTNQIALWDVAKSCNRKGSSDASISDAKANNIDQILKEHESITEVLCNGKKAYLMLRRFFSNINIAVSCLPSTSPANATMTYAKKFNEWEKALSRSLCLEVK